MIAWLGRVLGIDPIYGGVPRSPLWRHVRAQHLKLNPYCFVCGDKGSLLQKVEVHHCVPYSVDKSLELKGNNLITLCRRCHLIFGHLGSFASYNPTIKPDAQEWRVKISKRP